MFAWIFSIHVFACLHARCFIKCSGNSSESGKYEAIQMISLWIPFTTQAYIRKSFICLICANSAGFQMHLMKHLLFPDDHNEYVLG